MTTPHTPSSPLYNQIVFSKTARTAREKSSWSDQTLTPNGGVIKKGTRGEGDDLRVVEKRLQLTPGGSNEAFHETRNKEGCSQDKRCKECASYTNQNIDNTRWKKRNEEEKEEKRKEEEDRKAAI